MSRISVDCINLLLEQAARSSRSRFGRWMARLELPWTRRSEGQLICQFARGLTTSAKDRAALEQLACPVNRQRPRPPSVDKHGFVLVLPNSVDLDYFIALHYPPLSERVIVSGKMSYHANVTAALHLMNDSRPLSCTN